MPSELGIEIYVPSARPMSAFRPERTVLFVHGAAYPAHTSFDLKLDGMLWMDARLRRLSPRPSRLRPLHPSERDGQGARGQPADGARHGGVTTNVQCVGLERGLSR